MRSVLIARDINTRLAKSMKGLNQKSNIWVFDAHSVAQGQVKRRSLQTETVSFDLSTNERALRTFTILGAIAQAAEPVVVAVELQMVHSKKKRSNKNFI